MAVFYCVLNALYYNGLLIRDFEMNDFTTLHLKELRAERLQASERIKTFLNNMPKAATSPEHVKEVQRLMADLEVIDNKIQSSLGELLDSVSH